MPLFSLGLPDVALITLVQSLIPGLQDTQKKLTLGKRKKMTGQICPVRILYLRRSRSARKWFRNQSHEKGLWMF